MAQQTAVGWIEEKIKIYLPSIHQKGLQDVFVQAKAIEKEHIKEGYIMSLLDGDNKIRRDAEDYYNETYNK